MPQLSVVVPVFNERDNIPPLLAEIATALRGTIDYEVIYVDDDSIDDSRAVLAAQKALHPELRVLHHVTRSGQSTAVWNGVRAAKSPWIATLDGDGQNDPADIPKLLAAREVAAADLRLFAGWRTTRRDSFNKRISSKIANAVRSRMLRDATPDTGCGLKLFDREVFPSALLRSHAPLPARLGQARRVCLRKRSSRPSTAYRRRVQIRHARSPLGWPR
jgi:dolichol-phosphate mannosyltransferase